MYSLNKRNWKRSQGSSKKAPIPGGLRGPQHFSVMHVNKAPKKFRQVSSGRDFTLTTWAMQEGEGTGPSAGKLESIAGCLVSVSSEQGLSFDDAKHMLGPSHIRETLPLLPRGTRSPGTGSLSRHLFATLWPATHFHSHTLS
jgi:hypothetical protein